MNDNKLWMIFDNLEKQEEKDALCITYGVKCTHKSTTRITNLKVCCTKCGLVLFDPVIPYVYKQRINRQIKKDLLKNKRLEKELKYQNIKTYDEQYKELTEYLGKKKLYLFYKTKVEKLFFFLFNN